MKKPWIDILGIIWTGEILEKNLRYRTANKSMFWFGSTIILANGFSICGIGEVYINLKWVINQGSP